MIDKSEITQEKFDSLLLWLDRNRELAGQKYEKIRRRLVQIFVGRGCTEAEDLADETMNRVTLKLPQLASDYVGEPGLYFYGVAQKVHLEWTRKRKKIYPIDLDNTPSEIEEKEFEYRCLESCLDLLAPESKFLIVEYYREDKSSKIDLRRTLAAKLKISPNALQIKTSRIRSELRKCVSECMKGDAA